MNLFTVELLIIAWRGSKLFNYLFRLWGHLKLQKKLSAPSTIQTTDQMAQLLRESANTFISGSSPGISGATESSTVPNRVTCYVPIKAVPSTIEGAGRGLFVEKDVTAGDLLFSIKQPLVRVVNQRGISQICNNSYLAFIDGNCNVLRLSAAEPTFLKCGGCKSVSYCSRVLRD
jgi:hypothetical protein